MKVSVVISSCFCEYSALHSAREFCGLSGVIQSRPFFSFDKRVSEAIDDGLKDAETDEELLKVVFGKTFWLYLGFND